MTMECRILKKFQVKIENVIKGKRNDVVVDIAI